eukprot:1161258-Pelagomonas_calceolata.AAC.5
MQIRWLSGMLVRRLTANSPKWAPPDPGPSKGIHKSMLMNVMPAGAAPGAWLGETGQLLSAPKHRNGP